MRSMLVRLAFLGFAVALFALPVVADDEPVPGPTAEVLAPKEAWSAFNREIRDVPRRERRAARVERAATYLDAFDLADLKPKGEDWVYLGMFQVAADRAHAAYTCFHAAMSEADLEATDRASAGNAVASLLANATHCAELDGKECTDDAVQLVSQWLATDPSAETVGLCAAAHMSLGAFFARTQEKDVAVEHFLSAARLSANNAYGAGRSIGRTLMGSTCALKDYAKLLEQAQEVQGELVELATKARDEARSSQVAVDADEAASDREKQMAKRRVDSAERGVERLGNMLVPFEMLGKPAPAWTLEHAYGETKTLEDMKGKVVLLDFWATWCPWCIKSFPALRDLLRDYGKQGFAVVGITATASAVYESRYGLDDDLKSKQAEGERSKPVARLARGSATPDPEKGVYGPERYREIETAAIQTFIDNHQMDWSVVMIDKSEPAAKYALSGWPHAVLLDRQGRVRYFKVGALLRDRAEQVKHFREILEQLLSEE